MATKHCSQCGALITDGLRYRDMIFCMDECAAKFGIDPNDCFFGGADDCIDYQNDSESYYY